MMIVTRINGLKSSGVFTLAFSLACLLCLIGGYEGRVYQVTDVKNEYSDVEYIVHRIITCVIMMVIVIFYCFIMKYDAYKFIVTVFIMLNEMILKCFQMFSMEFFKRMINYILLVFLYS